MLSRRHQPSVVSRLRRRPRLSESRQFVHQLPSVGASRLQLIICRLKPPLKAPNGRRLLASIPKLRRPINVRRSSLVKCCCNIKRLLDKGAEEAACEKLNKNSRVCQSSLELLVAPLMRDRLLGSTIASGWCLGLLRFLRRLFPRARSSANDAFYQHENSTLNIV